MTRKALVFGTFDGFDAGHQFFIEEAAKKGTELIAAVARDEHVRTLKKKEPRNSESVRLQRVAEDPHISQAFLSDEQLGSYIILNKVQPDVLVLGFDQDALKSDIIRWLEENHRTIPIETLTYLPE
jgi:cytidyltransferase-like protein